MVNDVTDLGGEGEAHTEDSTIRIYLPVLPLVLVFLESATYLWGVNMGVAVVLKVKAFEND